jgi:hypothetical protein
MNEYLMRNPAVVMLAGDNSCYFLRPGRVPVVLPSPDIAAIARLMQACSEPILESHANQLIDGQIKSVLLEERVLLRASEGELKELVKPQKPAAKACKNLVLGLTGAVHSAQISPLVMDLLHGFTETIDVILTDGAQQIVNPGLFRAMGIRVWTDTFSAQDGINVPHIHLAHHATLIAVVPASAHTLHKIAHGACSDLLSLTVTATAAPVILFPVMNGQMWAHPAIQRSVQQCRADGCYVVEPGLGGEVSRHEENSKGYGTAGLGGFGLTPLLSEIFRLLKNRHSAVS